MCSVQVVLMGHPDLLRPSRPAGGVCRRLFSESSEGGGKSDPGRFLRAMEAELRRRDTERWNFDFQKEQPLPGRYLWEPVGAQRPKEKDCDIVEEVAVCRKESGSMPVSAGKKAKRSGAGVPTQAKITDFLKKRKRPETEDSPKLKMRRLSSTLPSSNILAPSIARPT